MLCDGRQSCTFNQTILDYPQGSITKLCNDHDNGNFIHIRYECINGKRKLCFNRLFLISFIVTLLLANVLFVYSTVLLLLYCILG